MNGFTLLNALNIVVRHLIVTIAIFYVTFMVVPNLNILEDRYQVEKTIKLGSYEPPHFVALLGKEEIHAIASSGSTRVFLNNTLGKGGVAQYSVEFNEKTNNIVLVLKNGNPDNIINTADLVMSRLQEEDHNRIKGKVALMDKVIADKLDYEELISRSDFQAIPSSSEVEELANISRIFNKNFNSYSNSDMQVDLDDVVNLKRDQTIYESKQALDIMKNKQEIELLELVKKTGFKTVSFIYPIDRNQIKKYYPNTVVYFGISLLAALFYNLILLSFKYRRSVK